MSITAEEAAEIARRHGLNLADAAGLRALADDAEHGEAIAGRFARSKDGDVIGELLASGPEVDFGALMAKARRRREPEPPPEDGNRALLRALKGNTPTDH